MTVIISGDNGVSDVDGSAGTPAIRGTDANTGIFFGSDIIGFSEGGTECARFNADAQFVAAAGTASLPVITTTGDVNTGIFFPAADTIAFAEGGAEAMRIDSSSNLLVGGTSQSGTANKVCVKSGDKFGLSIIDTTAQTTGVGGALNLGGNYRAAGDAQAFTRVAALKENSTDANYSYAMGFYTTPNGGTFTERARIDSSGRLLVGSTSTSISSTQSGEVYSVGSSGFALINSTAGNWACSVLNQGASGTRNLIRFMEGAGGGTQRGSITTDGSTVAYNITSDYRLKENVAPMTGALTKILALNPCTYTWKHNGLAGEGFIAHELQAVCPDAVTGEKDALETYTDEDGVEQTRPVYQGVDTSFLVATLTAAIQELKAINDAQASRIETLEAKVAALEAK